MLRGFLADVIAANLAMDIPNLGRFRKYFLLASLRENGAMLALGAFGAVLLVRRRRSLPAGLGAIVGASLLASFAGYFLIKPPLRQYFLSFLPQIAVLGALALAHLIGLLRERFSAPMVWVAVIVAVAACVVPPARGVAERYESRSQQSDVLRRVLEASRPGDRVFDCWTGLYLTRLPAYRYFYLNFDIQSTLDREALETDLLRALRNPEVRVAIVDANCANLPRSVLAFIRKDFAPLPGTKLVRFR